MKRRLLPLLVLGALLILPALAFAHPLPHPHVHGVLAAGLGFVLASGLLLAAAGMAWRLTRRRMPGRPVAFSAGAALVAAGAVFLVLLV